MEIKLTASWIQDVQHVFGVERKLSLPAKAFLIMLRASDGHTITAPQPFLSRQLSIGIRGLRLAIKELEAHGLILITMNQTRWGTKSASTYQLFWDIDKTRIWEGEG